jgi:hypothetical protein
MSKSLLGMGGKEEKETPKAKAPIAERIQEVRDFCEKRFDPIQFSNQGTIQANVQEATRGILVLLKEISDDVEKLKNDFEHKLDCAIEQYRNGNKEKEPEKPGNAANKTGGKKKLIAKANQIGKQD